MMVPKRIDVVILLGQTLIPDREQKIIKMGPRTDKFCFVIQH